jgi:ABC-2 type transport system permease protein
VTANLATIRALVARALNELTRVPGAAVPGVLAPTIFLIGLSGVFGQAAHLPGFDATDFRTFVVPVGLLQGATFTGAATGLTGCWSAPLRASRSSSASSPPRPSGRCCRRRCC